MRCAIRCCGAGSPSCSRTPRKGRPPKDSCWGHSPVCWGRRQEGGRVHPAASADVPPAQEESTMIDVITVLGFIAALYVIVILAVWRAAGEQARPVYERYDPARHEFPRAVSAWLEANANALSREGFAVAGDLLRLGPPTTQRVLLIVNDVTEERGMVAAVLGSKGGGGMFVEFTAERPDG